VNPAAYLDADASALADREHTNTHTNTNTAARALSDTHLHELDYAADLFRRGADAVSGELERLRGVDVPLDWLAIDRACRTLLCAGVVLRIRALREHERRAA
jgi:hypothetical protein